MPVNPTFPGVYLQELPSGTRTIAGLPTSVTAFVGRFGRRFIDYDPTELAADVLYQLGALEGLARTAGTRVSYVKPHGGLYNTIVTHEVQARAVIDAIAEFDETLPVLLRDDDLVLSRSLAAPLRRPAGGEAQ